MGDRIDFTVTGVQRIGQLRVASSITGFARLSGGNAVMGLAQSISSVDFTQAGALDSYESELVSLAGTLSSDMGAAGSGYQSAGLVTAGNTDAGVLRLRLPHALAESQGLGAGCSVQLGSTPLWRFNAQAQPSAFVSTELAGSSCPTPVLLSAAATSSTAVRALFNRPMNPNSITTGTMSIAGLTVSAVSGSGTLWTLTTSAQTPGQGYTLTASTSVTDVRGTPISSSGRTASFSGFTTPIGGLVINEVDYDNIGTDNNEYIELFNSGSSAVSLAGLSLVLVNGSTNAAYDTIALPSVSVPAGGYFVVGSSTLIATLPGGVQSLAFGAASNNLQNDAEGIVLVNSVGVWLDAMTYEAPTAAGLTYLGVAVTEGAGATSALVDSNVNNVSIGRIPNGTDTNNNAGDFTVNSAPTPGAANVP